MSEQKQNCFEKLHNLPFQCQWRHLSLRTTLPPSRATNKLNLPFCALIRLSLSNSVEESDSWKANGYSARRPAFMVQYQTVLYLLDMSPPLVPILSQIKPIYSLLSYLFKINLNIIHLDTSASSKRSPSFRLSHEILYAFIFSPSHTTWVIYYILSDVNILKNLEIIHLIKNND